MALTASYVRHNGKTVLPIDALRTVIDARIRVHDWVAEPAFRISRNALYEFAEVAPKLFYEDADLLKLVAEYNTGNWDASLTQHHFCLTLPRIPAPPAPEKAGYDPRLYT